MEIKKRWYIEEGGCAHLLGTRPDTVGYGLNDSPVGLAAWIIEKWYAWTAPPSGNLEEHFTKDELLTNVTIYWLTQTILSANRYYHFNYYLSNASTAEKYRLLDIIEYPTNRSIRFGHDSKGNLTRSTFPDATFRTTTYDAAKRRIAETDQAGRSTLLSS